MRQRGVRTGGADGVEARILEHAARLAEFAQFGRRGQLVDFARGRMNRDPAQEARHRRPVAGLRVAVALLFGRVLDRLGQDGGVVGADDGGAAFREGVKDARDRMVRIDRHGLALERFERGHEVRPVAHRHCIAQMFGQFGRDLLGRDEQLRRAVRMREDIGQRDRRVVDVLPTHIEQPGDRIERADDGRIVALGLEPVGHLGALVRARTARVLVIMRHRWHERGLWPVVPDRIDRIALDGNQLDALFCEQLVRFLGPADPMEPGIVADPGTLGCVLGDPLCG